jgi:thiol-disulfide isomerase/thioredoxin
MHKRKKKLVSIMMCVVIIIINITLTLELRKTKNDLSIYKGKITLNLSEQRKMLEHNYEGINLNNEIQLIYDNIINQLNLKKNNYKIIYIIDKYDCEHCIHTILEKYLIMKEFFNSKNINIFFIFTNYDNANYYGLVNQYNIADISLKDENIIFRKKISYTGIPTILLLNKKNVIIYATITNYKEEEKMNYFFYKVKALFNEK